jgi:NADH:ubiquinone oxidoreductase subunit 2 (subunit N)
VLIFISPYFVILVKVISISSIALGTIYAFSELNFKRFWALTAIVNLGYIIFAFSLGTAEGLTIGLFYLFLYLLNTLFV